MKSVLSYCFLFLLGGLFMPAINLEVIGFTKLGSDATGIKTKFYEVPWTVDCDIIDIQNVSIDESVNEIISLSVVWTNGTILIPEGQKRSPSTGPCKLEFHYELNANGGSSTLQVFPDAFVTTVNDCGEDLCGKGGYLRVFVIYRELIV